MNNIEKKWTTYFDELGIQYMYKPSKYTLDDGDYIPDFYLPDFMCFVEVFKGPISDKAFDRFYRMIKKTHIPTVLLTRNPDYKFVEILSLPNKNSSETEPIPCHLVQDKNRKKGKFLTMAPFNCKRDFIDAGYPEVIRAVEAANS